MKHKTYILLIIIISIYSNCDAQGLQNDKSDIFYQIPQEKVFVHYNSTFLVSGETLLYKIYCINSRTKKLSTLSKIAYVELIDSDFNVHFRHKIKLNSGLGQGDFFIPTSLESGNYKIVAYTKWMLNKPANNFFHGDLNILNPYADNSPIVSETNDSLGSLKNSRKTIESKTNNNELLSLSINKNNFDSREKVRLQVSTSNYELAQGHYSISVRKIDTVSEVSKTNALTHKSLFYNDPLEQNMKIPTVVPEFRGEIISGNVVDKNNNVVPNLSVSISIPGKDYVFKVSKTDDKGDFYFNVEENYKSADATIQIINDSSEGFEIIMNDNFQIDYSSLLFTKLELSHHLIEQYSERSIHTQIENSFRELKQDISVIQNIDNNIYSTINFKFLLDDYTRFSTLKETITENIHDIFYTKKGDDYSLHLYGFNQSSSEINPLVLIDGHMILDHNEIIDLNPEKIKEINVLRHNYSFGSKLFQGIIYMKTFDGDYKSYNTKNSRKNIELLKPLTPKQYFNLVYEGTDLNRIPDYRNQLLWEPNFEFNKDQEAVIFYTSDDKGMYEINLEGFTNNGSPISLKIPFHVN